MSTIYKRKESPYWWWTTVFNGQRYYRSTKMTKKNLAQKIKEKWDFNVMMEDLSFLGFSQNTVTTVNEYFLEYLDFLSQRKSENTIAIANGVLKKLQQFLATKDIHNLDEINVKVLNDYIDSLKCAPKTKKNHIGIISLLLDQAIREELIDRNPAKLVTLPQIHKVIKHRPLTQEDLDVIFSNSGKWELYYAYLYFTGLRAGDVAQLKFGHIDYKKRALTGYVRKSRRLHELPLAEELVLITPKGDQDDPIFPNLYSEDERKLNDKLFNPRKYLQRILRNNGLPKATLHSFRVTFNNALRDLGLSIEDRQILLAHSSSETTKIYTHPNFDLAAKYVNQIPIFKGKVKIEEKK